MKIHKLTDMIINEYGAAAGNVRALDPAGHDRIKMFKTMTALLLNAREIEIYRLIGEYEKARGIISKARQQLDDKYETNPVLCDQLDLLLADHECNLQWEVGEYQGVFGSARHMLVLARKVHDVRTEAEALNMLGLAYQSQGKYDDAIDHFKQSYDKSLDVKDANFSATILNNIGDLYYDMGDFLKAQEYLKEGVELIEGTDNLKSLSIGLNNLGSIFYIMNQSDIALDYYVKALDLVRKVGDKRNEAILTNNIGTIYDQLGRIRQSLEYYNEAIKIQKIIGDVPGVATTMNNIGYGYMELMEYDKSLQYLSKCKELWNKSGYSRGEIVSGKNIAQIFIQQNQLDAAANVLANVVDVLKELPDQEFEKQTTRLYGLLEIRRQDPMKARRHADRLASLARSSKKESDRADALVLFGQISMLEGDPVKAVEQFNDALDIYQRSKLLYKVAETQYLYASVVKDLDPEKAKSLILSAIDFFKNAGAPKWVEECEKLLKG